MGSNDSMYILSSDSSDEYSLDQFAVPGSAKKRARAGSSKPASSSTPAPPGKADDEPDWVKNYTPAGEADSDRRAAFIAALDDEDDDDSFVDLVPDSGEGDKAAQKADKRKGGKTENKDKGTETPSTSKRARTVQKRKTTLPLTVAPKLINSLVLVQGSDDGLDLSGDIGAVGRVKLEEGNLFLDIKGVVYRANSYDCNTLCMVNVGDEEAKIIAVMDEAVKLTATRNLFASDEIMVHGELGEEFDDNESQSELDGKTGTNVAPGNGAKKAKTKSKGRVTKKNSGKVVRKKS